MNKPDETSPERPAEDLEDDLRPEYDENSLHSGVRGKYAASYTAGTNLALLAPDVAAAFPDDRSVNEALRSLIREGRVPAGGSSAKGR